MRVFTIALFPHPPLVYCSLAITKRWYDVFGAGAVAVAERAEKNLPRLLIINFKLCEREIFISFRVQCTAQCGHM